MSEQTNEARNKMWNVALEMAERARVAEEALASVRLELAGHENVQGTHALCFEKVVRDRDDARAMVVEAGKYARYQDTIIEDLLKRLRVAEEIRDAARATSAKDLELRRETTRELNDMIEHCDEISTQLDMANEKNEAMRDRAIEIQRERDELQFALGVTTHQRDVAQMMKPEIEALWRRLSTVSGELYWGHVLSHNIMIAASLCRVHEFAHDQGWELRDIQENARGLKYSEREQILTEHWDPMCGREMPA